MFKVGGLIPEFSAKSSVLQNFVKKGSNFRREKEERESYKKKKKKLIFIYFNYWSCICSFSANKQKKEKQYTSDSFPLQYKQGKIFARKS